MLFIIYFVDVLLNGFIMTSINVWFILVINKNETSNFIGDCAILNCYCDTFSFYYFIDYNILLFNITEFTIT